MSEYARNKYKYYCVTPVLNYCSRAYWVIRDWYGKKDIEGIIKYAYYRAVFTTDDEYIRITICSSVSDQIMRFKMILNLITIDDIKNMIYKYKEMIANDR